MLPLLLLLRAIGLDLLDPKAEVDEPNVGVALLFLPVLALSILAQLFVTALAIGQAGETVGALLGRLLPKVPQGFLIGFAQALPVSLGLQTMALAQPGLALVGAGVAGLGFYVFARLLLALPALIAEGEGIVAALQRSWQLTSGRSLGVIALLLGLLVSFFLMAVLLIAVAAPIAAIATLVLGNPASGWGAAQWVNGLMLALLQASLTILLALVAGQTYRVLAR
ncbi:glycerophosphoryl diester phosphodiesterase membrane domain-containing protein [Thermaurantiacus sp.]